MSILILDGSQKMSGEVAQTAFKNLNRLFSINYSVTYAKEHKLIYVLDALYAYSMRLVRKIKSFESKTSVELIGFPMLPWERVNVGVGYLTVKDVNLKRMGEMKLTFEEMNSSLVIEIGTENLLERLEVDRVLAAQDETFDIKGLFPVTHKLIYNYDFGDNWMVTITKYKDCDDLIEQNIIADYELDEDEQTVISKNRPVCISKDGLSVLDDVEGLSRFADLLEIIFEDGDKKERDSTRAWARSLGWNTRKVTNKNRL